MNSRTIICPHCQEYISLITLVERFWTQVDRSGDCWVWIGTRNQKGYGRFKAGNAPIPAHRFSYELSNGKIPEGMLVCHTCDHPWCVNPTHLFLGTNAENMEDMVRKGRKKIVKGEEAGSSKLTDQDVFDIRAAFATGEGAITLAKKYGLNRQTIYDITSRKTWKHV